MTDPIRIISRLKNNRLAEFREGLGLSAPKFAALIGIHYHTYIAIESCRRYPSLWSIKKIASATGADPEWLFPEYLKRIARNVSVTTIPEHKLLSLEGMERKLLSSGEIDKTDKKIDREILIREIEKSLITLTPREEQVIKMRFGLGDGSEYTLEEVAQRFGLTRERIRGIETNALRKLRRPERSNRLKPFVRS